MATAGEATKTDTSDKETEMQSRLENNAEGIEVWYPGQRAHIYLPVCTTHHRPSWSPTSTNSRAKTGQTQNLSIDKTKPFSSLFVMVFVVTEFGNLLLSCWNLDPTQKKCEGDEEQSYDRTIQTLQHGTVAVAFVVSEFGNLLLFCQSLDPI